MLDRQRLLELTDGSVEFERELIDAYIESLQTHLGELRAHVLSGDSARAATIVHALKGASLNIGAIAIGQCLADIEDAVRAGVPSSIDALLQELARQEQAIRRELGRR